jgi:hypothetical protein
MKKLILAASLLVLFFATPALAVGPLVGTNCSDSWAAPTTFTDGSLAPSLTTSGLSRTCRRYLVVRQTSRTSRL